MNYTVTESNVTECRYGIYCIEASTLGLPVGKYPSILSTNMGNGLPFTYEKTQGDTVIYRQIAGSIFLHVLND